MPPESPKEQEIMLKKRARRRLVGALALVLLMIVVLPQLLEDRALQLQQEPIKITMSNAAASQLEVNQGVVSDVSSSETSQPESNANSSSQGASETPFESQTTAYEQAQKDSEKSLVASESGSKVSAVETLPAVKSSVPAEATAKPAGAFSVQVGVYSDAANVKRLQDELKQAGFETYTEKIQTSKGDSIRLKAGKYATRADAANALSRIKATGLPGMVVAE